MKWVALIFIIVGLFLIAGSKWPTGEEGMSLPALVGVLLALVGGIWMLILVFMAL